MSRVWLVPSGTVSARVGPLALKGRPGRFASLIWRKLLSHAKMLSKRPKIVKKSLLEMNSFGFLRGKLFDSEPQIEKWNKSRRKEMVRWPELIRTHPDYLRMQVEQREVMNQNVNWESGWVSAHQRVKEQNRRWWMQNENVLGNISMKIMKWMIFIGIMAYFSTKT